MTCLSLFIICHSAKKAELPRQGSGKPDRII